VRMMIKNKWIAFVACVLGQAILSSIPASAASSTCDQIYGDLLKSSSLPTDIVVASRSFSFRYLSHATGASTYFPPETKIVSLTNDSGNVLLFRGIDAPYIPNFKGNRSNYIRHEANAYSYSLSPIMVTNWHRSKNILIALQHIETDQLLLPKMTNGKRGVKVYWEPITPESRIKDILHSDELKVPVGREKVLLVVPKEKMEQAIRYFKNQPFSPTDLLLKIKEILAAD